MHFLMQQLFLVTLCSQAHVAIFITVAWQIVMQKSMVTHTFNSGFRPCRKQTKISPDSECFSQYYLLKMVKYLNSCNLVLRKVIQSDWDKLESFDPCLQLKVKFFFFCNLLMHYKIIAVPVKHPFITSTCHIVVQNHPCPNLFLKCVAFINFKLNI